MEQSQTPPPAEDDNRPAEANPNDEGVSLESDVIDATSNKSLPGVNKPVNSNDNKPKGVKSLLRQFNIYLLFLGLIFVVAGVVLVVAYFQTKKSATTSTLKTQTLTQATLDQVANSDSTLGDNQTVLSVLSSAVFAGKVLVRQDLEVAGSLQIGGTVGLTNLTVAGTTQLGQAQISKDASIGGNIAVQGSSSIGQNLQVKGSGSFSGPVTAPQITTTNFQLNGDLTITHHIVIGGGTPGRTNGPALGSGGSSSVSGSDTAGTISINVGSSPGAGCFTTINFTRKYQDTPRVLITPVGPAAGKIDYYVSRTSSNFSVCTATAAPIGSSFSFDYFVVD